MRHFIFQRALFWLIKRFGYGVFGINTPRWSQEYINQKLENNLVGVEVGVAKGFNAKRFLEHSSIEKLYLVDPYYDNPEDLRVMIKKTQNYQFKRDIIPSSSEEAAKSLPDNLDFVYIDADHSYESVKEDLRLWYPKIRDGGILAGHDMDLYDVAKAVIEFGEEINNKPLTFRREYLWHKN